MKIILALENNLKSLIIESHDIILTNNYRFKKEYKNTIIVNYSFCDENPRLSESINHLFKIFPAEFQPFRNAFYMRVFRPINSLIYQIEKLIEKHKPTELTLNGGSLFKFVTLIGGEGEGDHVLYKSTWFFNSIINDYFKDLISVRWINRKQSFIFRSIHIIREYLLYSGKLASSVVKNLTRKEVKPHNSSQNKSLHLLGFVILPLQFKHLTNILSEITDKELTFVSPVTSIVFGENVIKYKIKLKDYYLAIRKYKNIKNAGYSTGITYKIKDKYILFDRNTLLRSVKLNFILYYSNLNAISDFLTSVKPSGNCLLVTNMTFGEDIIVVDEIAKNMKLPHYNFQAVTMSKMLFPQMKLAHKYFLYSQKTFQLYRNLESSYHYYFPNYKSKSSDSIVNRKKIVVLTLFTQPDSYTGRYLAFLEEIIPSLRSLGNVKLNIKPHYRQNKIHDFKNLTKDCPFIKIESSTVPPEDIINHSDFSLSMTSAVLFETITLNCPGIIIDFDGIDRKYIDDNDSCFPEINFVIKKKQDLIDIINNSEEYKEIFTKRKSEYMIRNSAIEIKDIFHVH